MIILILMWVGAGFLAAYFASEKQRCYWAWLGLSAMFSPLLGLLALIALPVGNVTSNQKVGWQGL
jgi:hypothetical protein